MRGSDLLERCAERGDIRGAANVWANAHAAGVDAEPRQGEIAFRLLLGVWLVGAALMTLVAVRGNSEVVVDNAATDVQPTSAEPLPAPLAIDGLNLDWYQRPFGERFDADDLFGSASIDSISFNPSDDDANDRTIVFARPDDPFTGPIVGLHLFEEGGFRPWTANIEERDVPSFVDAVRSSNGQWSIGEETGLVKVAELGPQSEFPLVQWQFNFSSGGDRATLQSLAIVDDPARREWAWLALLLDTDQPTSITTTEVLDEPAVLLTFPTVDDDARDDRAASQLVWADGDFAYRLMASQLVGDRDASVPVNGVAEQLSVTARSDWLEMLQATDRASPVEMTVIAATALLGLVGVVLVGYFVLKRELIPLAMILTTVAALLVVGSPGPLFALALAGGIGLALWRYRFTSRP